MVINSLNNNYSNYQFNNYIKNKNTLNDNSDNKECETCKNRKYQDGSDEMVSFKSASHISPESSAARVRGHEQEHVINAYKEASLKNGKVIQASVLIKTAICPECGKSYISGGETTSTIKYQQEKNKFLESIKDNEKNKGLNIDMKA